ncbi:hypothetical protein [Roseibium sp.]|uniref:hypothetical protein n=1 Tax=Roseibium sp. TaxID=1936156 RepID=UPI003D12C7F4
MRINFPKSVILLFVFCWTFFFFLGVGRWTGAYLRELVIGPIVMATVPSALLWGGMVTRKWAERVDADRNERLKKKSGKDG